MDIKFHTENCYHEDHGNLHSGIARVHVLLTEPGPLEAATLAAMYSRSVAGVEEMSDKVKSDTAENFFEKFFVGYGHNSIGDLAQVSLFIEGIPMYIATAIQHSPLYNGQESSTRYINFKKQKPSFTSDPTLYREQINRYEHALEVVEHNIQIKNIHVLQAAEHNDPKQHNVILRAIRARAFDICRGLIPLGASTNVAWFASIRVICEHLAWMYTIPNPIFGIYAMAIHRALKEVYPKAIGLAPDAVKHPRIDPYLTHIRDSVAKRFEGPLDFGSYRDLHRHRAGWQAFSMPAPGLDVMQATKPNWYTSMLQVHSEAAHKELLDTRETSFLPSIITPAMELDHALMMTPVPACYIPGSQEMYDYFVRLRSKTSVHPTLRQFIANQKSYQLHNALAAPIPDAGHFGFFEQRGEETILYKGEELGYS